MCTYIDMLEKKLDYMTKAVCGLKKQIRKMFFQIFKTVGIAVGLNDTYMRLMCMKGIKKMNKK